MAWQPGQPISVNVLQDSVGILLPNNASLTVLDSLMLLEPLQLVLVHVLHLILGIRQPQLARCLAQLSAMLPIHQE